MDIDINDVIKRIEAKIADLHSQLAVEQNVLSRLKAYLKPNQSSQSGNNRRIYRGSIAKKIKSILTKEAKPMTTNELAEAIKKQGSSKDVTELKVQIASTVHRRTDIFARIDRGLYGLKNRQKEITLPK